MNVRAGTYLAERLSSHPTLEHLNSLPDSSVLPVQTLGSSWDGSSHWVPAAQVEVWFPASTAQPDHNRHLKSEPVDESSAFASQKMFLKNIVYKGLGKHWLVAVFHIKQWYSLGSMKLAVMRRIKTSADRLSEDARGNVHWLSFSGNCMNSVSMNNFSSLTCQSYFCNVYQGIILQVQNNAYI